LNENGVWVDPTGGVWRQAGDLGNVWHPQQIDMANMNAANSIKELSDYAAPAPPMIPDYER
jgi:hypothetical protein